MDIAPHPWVSGDKKIYVMGFVMADDAEDVCTRTCPTCGASMTVTHVKSAGDLWCSGCKVSCVGPESKK